MMNDNEAAGQLVHEYAAAVKRLAELRVTASRMCRLMRAVSDTFAYEDPDLTISVTGTFIAPSLAGEMAAGTWLCADEIGALWREMRHTITQIADVAGLLRQLGVPVAGTIPRE